MVVVVHLVDAVDRIHEVVIGETADLDRRGHALLTPGPEHPGDVDCAVLR
jgi:hypothetical protein